MELSLPILDLGLALAPADGGPRLPRTSDPVEARRAAQDFEAFFVAQVMEQMFAGIEPDALFGGGAGEPAFRSLLFQEYGKAVARAGGFGLADAVQREILRLQEA
ncbi:MAG TPA: rod-binding protein [Dongiaceae bacterium]|nr:rod-binding protein [Dongiaceae bacterium]